MTASPSPEAATGASTDPGAAAGLLDWLALLGAPGIGRRTARALLRRHGSPTAVLDACEQAQSAGPAAADDPALPTACIRALAPMRPAARALRDATLDWLAAGPQRRVIALDDPAYPATLLHTPDPPLLLHAEGRIELLGAAAVAIVGSRQATAQGVDNARHFARALSEAGLTVVSGLALGIDTAAHEGALLGPGSTVAVVGTGLDTVYPRRSLGLSRRIADRGLLLSEYPIGTSPRREHFPQRNRLIAGLARGTLLVEAALPSGSLITARLALESGRDVFAIPGSIHSPQSRGCHALIKQGAALADDPQDVLDGLAWSPGDPPAAAAQAAPGPEPGSAEDRLLLERLGHEPTTLDALLARTGWPVDQLQARLLEAELAGLVVRLPGGRLQRRTQA